MFHLICIFIASSPLPLPESPDPKRFTDKNSCPLYILIYVYTLLFQINYHITINVKYYIDYWNGNVVILIRVRWWLLRNMESVGTITPLLGNLNFFPKIYMTSILGILMIFIHEIMRLWGNLLVTSLEIGITRKYFFSHPVILQNEINHLIFPSSNNMLPSASKYPCECVQTAAATDHKMVSRKSNYPSSSYGTFVS